MEKNAGSSPSFHILGCLFQGLESARQRQSQALLWNSQPISIADLHQNRIEVIFRDFQNLMFEIAQKKHQAYQK